MSASESLGTGTQLTQVSALLNMPNLLAGCQCDYKMTSSELAFVIRTTVEFDMASNGT